MKEWFSSVPYYCMCLFPHGIVWPLVCFLFVKFSTKAGRSEVFSFFNIHIYSLMASLFPRTYSSPGLDDSYALLVVGSVMIAPQH